MKLENKGVLLALLTAVVSGVSIFANSFAVKGVDAFILTTFRNLSVALLLVALIVLLKEWKSVKALSKKSWAKLAALGLVGGSVPFLLFFYALTQTTAVNAGFIHKTMFVWTTLLAVVFLKEKPGKAFLAAAGLLLAGNLLLSLTISSFVFADLLVLAAVLLWSVENVYAKRVLKDLNARVAAFGRMFFGALFMLTFLAATGGLAKAAVLSFDQIGWILLTTPLLFGYVAFWYSSLKSINVSRATAVLMLGQPVTVLLSAVFLGKAVSLVEIAASALITFGVVLAVKNAFFLSALKTKVGFASSAEKRG
ncbi:DMT family transporter [Candidatus Micrarchaeota archaeon]|nr:DMT family transporter [Candidatus Micrarchaeota archaeon]